VRLIDCFDLDLRRGIYLSSSEFFVRFTTLTLILFCCLLISFVWLEALSLSLNETISPWLSKYSKLFIVITAGNITLGIAATIGAAIAGPAGLVLYIDIFGYSQKIVMFLFLIFYLYIGIKVQNFLNHAPETKIGKKRSKKTKKILLQMLRVALPIAVLLIMSIICDELIVFKTPPAAFFLILFEHFMCAFIVFTQSLVFYSSRNPITKFSHSKTGSQTDSTVERPQPPIQQ